MDTATDAQRLRQLLEHAADQAANLSTIVTRALESEALRARRIEAACLTPREEEVLDLVLEGRSSKEIARTLGIARATARCHVQNILTKLGVESRRQAAALTVPPAVLPRASPPPSSPSALAALTPRETEVLRALAAGIERREIAEHFFVSPHTVRTHVQRVLAKLGVHSVLGAMAVARTAGLTPLGSRAAPSL